MSRSSARFEALNLHGGVVLDFLVAARKQMSPARPSGGVWRASNKVLGYAPAVGKVTIYCLCLSLKAEIFLPESKVCVVKFPDLSIFSWKLIDILLSSVTEGRYFLSWFKTSFKIG